MREKQDGGVSWADWSHKMHVSLKLDGPAPVQYQDAPHFWHKGAELWAIRGALGLSQAQAAAEVGVPVNTWARWERDEMRPRKADHAEKLSWLRVDAMKAFARDEFRHRQCGGQCDFLRWWDANRARVETYRR